MPSFCSAHCRANHPTKAPPAIIAIIVIGVPLTLLPRTLIFVIHFVGIARVLVAIVSSGRVMSRFQVLLLYGRRVVEDFFGMPLERFSSNGAARRDCRYLLPCLQDGLGLRHGSPLE